MVVVARNNNLYGQLCVGRSFKFSGLLNLGHAIEVFSSSHLVSCVSSLKLTLLLLLFFLSTFIANKDQTANAVFT